MELPYVLRCLPTKQDENGSGLSGSVSNIGKQPDGWRNVGSGPPFVSWFSRLAASAALLINRKKLT